MADKITEEERRLIDEALEQGCVTKIPRGQSAFAYCYDPITNKLIPDKEKTTGKNLPGQKWITPFVLNRRARLTELVTSGHSLRQCLEIMQAEGIQVEEHDLKNDVKKLRLSPREHNEVVNDQRLKELRRLLLEGVTRKKDLAALLDIAPNTFYTFLRRNRISCFQRFLADGQTHEPDS